MTHWTLTRAAISTRFVHGLNARRPPPPASLATIDAPYSAPVLGARGCIW